jgi:hypothetical protein
VFRVLLQKQEFMVLRIEMVLLNNTEWRKRLNFLRADLRILCREQTDPDNGIVFFICFLPGRMTISSLLDVPSAFTCLCKFPVIRE